MASDVSLTNDWIYRRFFLSNIRSASRLFCCNTSDGFTFGQINLDTDEFLCEHVDTNHSGLQIDILCWLPQTIHRPSRKQLHIGFTSLPTNNQSTAIYHNDLDHSKQSLKYLDQNQRLTPSSIDYNESSDQLAVSHLNGTVKFYKLSENTVVSQSSFAQDGILHRLEWNPLEFHLLLLAHQSRVNLFDHQREKNVLTLNQRGKEHLADCSWKGHDLIIARHRQQILVWDKRVSREPIRNEVLDPFGQSEKLKSSLHLLSLYDSRLNKIKIYDWRHLTMRQVESFDSAASSFLDYHWMIDKMALVVATHQGLLHWIDVDVPNNCKFLKKKSF